MNGRIEIFSEPTTNIPLTRLPFNVCVFTIDAKHSSCSNLRTTSKYYFVAARTEEQGRARQGEYI